MDNEKGNYLIKQLPSVVLSVFSVVYFGSSDTTA